MDPQRLYVSLPGDWIEHNDREWAGFCRSLLLLALLQYEEAVVCCLKFEQLLPDTLKLSVSRNREDDRLLSIFAKSFVYAIDTARDLLLVLSKDPRVEPQTQHACLAFATEFEVTKHIRDSLQHLDERAQGMSFNKPPPTPFRELGSFLGKKFVA